MIEVAELWGSRRWRVGRTPSVELTFTITGTDDDAAALAALMASSPPAYANLPRTDYSLERTGDAAWTATVSYGLQSQDFGLIALDFSVATQQHTLTQSYATTRYAPPGQTPPDFKGAIQVTSQGVQGVQIELPTLEWSETWRHPDQSINGLAYARALYPLIGTVNNAPFRNFAAGEILFRNVTGRKTRDDAWEFTYSFAASPNATNLTIGTITGIAKQGWQYLWVHYEDDTDDNAKTLIKSPRAVYVETVYRTSNFAAIGIGT